MIAPAKQWAIRLSKILKIFHDAHPDVNLFPINVAKVAKEYSRQLYPDEPITLIKGDDFSDAFEGTLIPNPNKSGEWGILYNKAIKSQGRINFTLGHEFGHYLQHRHLLSQGVQCSRSDMLKWQTSDAQIEHEANIFAANFLMPSSDFTKQMHNKNLSKKLITSLADRYGVSISSAALRWLELTNNRAMIVSCKDRFIDWAWSNKNLIKSGTYYTPKQQVIEAPANSLISANDYNESERTHKSGVWAGNEEVREILLYNKNGFALSLLLYPKDITYGNKAEDAENTEYELNFSI